MAAQREAHSRVILDDLFALGHFGQGDGWFDDALAIEVGGKERQGFRGRQGAGLPERLTAGQAKAVERVRLGQ